MSSWARYDKEFTDEKIFTAGIVEEGVVLTAEESLERILWGREKGGVGRWPRGCGASAHLRIRELRRPHTPDLQAGRSALNRH